jgi:four helix bundle protein
MDLVLESYKLAALFPRNETYGLRSQLQRTAVFIPANIAKGHGRKHLGDYLHHLSVANGSRMELETHILIALRLSYVKEKQADAIPAAMAELGRMLAGLIKSLKSRQADT